MGRTRSTGPRRFACALALGLLVAAAPASAGDDDDDDDGRSFQRIATFPVFLNTDVDLETVAEIVAASENGKTLVYTDGETGNIGFVDITDPADPRPDGVVAVGGEPTSVAVAGRYALVAVNTSPDFVNPSGLLQVVDIEDRTIARTIDLDGQPDSIAVSPDRRYAGIAIENERDEDLGDGRPPQAPPGFFVIVDLKGAPASWSTRTVDLTGIADRFPDDPEPEFVDINRRNVAAVTLQENNHVVLIHLRRGRVIGDFSTGTESLEDVDIEENDLIELKDPLVDLPREPDAVAWVSRYRLATADEGDLDGGTRGFTVFNKRGKVKFAPGNTVDQTTARLGHYPEDRSENKGNEPEGVEFGRYEDGRFLFVGSERSSVILVYRLSAAGTPKRLEQVLPAGTGPEGLLAIPERNLFVVASEVDDRDGKIRSSITLYERRGGGPTYPTVRSADRPDGTPIPWGALSGLAGDRADGDRAYAVYDSFYNESRIFTLDVGDEPAVITDELVLTKDGATVDLDLEGLVQRAGGGFWVVSEGAGSVDDPARSVTSLNLLLEVAPDGTILEEVELPASVNALQRRFGFEGVAVTGVGDDERVYVAFQREWVGDPDDQVRIGRYEPANDAWTFFYYPLDTPTSPNGGWVGLSEIVALDDETFAVIERDNQAGPDARIKKVYSFSVAGLEPQPQGGSFPLVTKTLVRDLIPDLTADNGPVLEKVAGLTVTAYGEALIVTDNDGVADSSGETQFINLGTIFGGDGDDDEDD